MKSLKNPKLGVVLAAVLAASMWCYADRILIPYEIADAARTERPRGNLSDLYPRWLGARELLLHGRDPYSPGITREIQVGYYGRPLDPQKANDPKDQQAFAYPLYVVFLLAPTVWLQFSLVQMLFRWLLVALVCVSVPLWARALGVKLGATSTLIGIVLVLGSFPTVQGIKLQQLTLLVCGLLAAAAAALATSHLIAAGVILGLATIKPQLTAICIAWLALWVLGDWKSRKRLAASFSVTTALLVAAGEWLLPGWVGRFYTAAGAYWNYTGGGNSWLDVALSPALGKGVAAIVVFMLAVYCWRVRRYSESSPAFAWTMALVFATTLLVIPTYAAYNQLLLVPALILIADWVDRSRPRKGVAFLTLVITAIAVFWPWLSALALDVASLTVPASSVQRMWAVPLWATPALPFTVLASILTCMKKMTSDSGRAISA